MATFNEHKIPNTEIRANRLEQALSISIHPLLLVSFKNPKVALKLDTLLNYNNYLEIYFILLELGFRIPKTNII